jgi:tRNA pseudouridine38-40 synthase
MPASGCDLEIPELIQMPLKKVRCINAYLPEDIRVMKAAKCQPGFHSRFNATGKQYRYFIWNYPSNDPLLRRFSWHIPVKLDIKKMKLAAAQFVGTHDFKSFAANKNYEVENTVRTLWKCDLKKSGNLITFIIEGDGFCIRCVADCRNYCQVGLEH